VVTLAKAYPKHLFNWQQMYYAMLNESCIWDFKDLFTAAVSLFGWQDTVMQFFGTTYLPRVVDTLLKDRSCPFDDESGFMGLLDLLTSLILQDHSGSMKARNLRLLERARVLANHIENNNPALMMTKPYIQWLLAESLLEMEAPSASPEGSRCHNLKILRLEQGPGINLPICVPSQNAVKLDWDNFMYRAGPGQKHTVEVAIRAADEIGDYGLRADAIKLLILQSDDPKPWFPALAKLQSDVQGDQEGYLATCLSSYLVSTVPGEEADLLSRLVDPVQMGEETWNIEECDNVSLRWAWSMFRVFSSLTYNGSLEELQPLVSELFRFDGSGLPLYVAAFTFNELNVPLPKSMDPLPLEDPNPQGQKQNPTKQGKRSKLPGPRDGLQIHTETQVSTGLNGLVGLPPTGPPPNLGGWMQHPSPPPPPSHPRNGLSGPGTPFQYLDDGQNDPLAKGVSPEVRVTGWGSDWFEKVQPAMSTTTGYLSDNSSGTSSGIYNEDTPSLAEQVSRHEGALRASSWVLNLDSAQPPEDSASPGRQHTRRRRVRIDERSLKAARLRKAKPKDQRNAREGSKGKSKEREKGPTKLDRKQTRARDGPTSSESESVSDHSETAGQEPVAKLSIPTDRLRREQGKLVVTFDIQEMTEVKDEREVTTKSSDLETEGSRKDKTRPANNPAPIKTGSKPAATAGSSKAPVSDVKDSGRHPVEDLRQKKRPPSRRQPSIISAVESEVELSVIELEDDIQNADPDAATSIGDVTTNDLVSKLASLAEFAKKDDDLFFVSHLRGIASSANIRGDDGNTLLHAAVFLGHTELLKRLVSCANKYRLFDVNGSDALLDFNTRNKNGYTPLHLAVHSDDIEIVSALVQDNRQITVNTPDNEDNTPLHLAAQRGFAPLVERLLQTKHVNPDIFNRAGKTPLHLAVALGHDAVVRVLRASKKVNFNARDMSGDTPLHLAVRCGHGHVVRELLLDENVETDMRNRDGQTALDLAMEKGYATICELLGGKGGKVDTRGESSGTSPNQDLKGDDDHACKPPPDPANVKDKGVGVSEVRETDVEVVKTVDTPVDNSPSREKGKGVETSETWKQDTEAVNVVDTPAGKDSVVQDSRSHTILSVEEIAASPTAFPAPVHTDSGKTDITLPTPPVSRPVSKDPPPAPPPLPSKAEAMQISTKCHLPFNKKPLTPQSSTKGRPASGLGFGDKFDDTAALIYGIQRATKAPLKEMLPTTESAPPDVQTAHAAGMMNLDHVPVTSRTLLDPVLAKATRRFLLRPPPAAIVKQHYEVTVVDDESEQLTFGSPELGSKLDNLNFNKSSADDSGSDKPPTVVHLSSSEAGPRMEEGKPREQTETPQLEGEQNELQKEDEVGEEKKKEVGDDEVTAGTAGKDEGELERKKAWGWMPHEKDSEEEWAPDS
jgi:ankyrin repeat protein